MKGTSSIRARDIEGKVATGRYLSFPRNPNPRFGFMSHKTIIAAIKPVLLS
jgi:hypothetical protein